MNFVINIRKTNFFICITVSTCTTNACMPKSTLRSSDRRKLCIKQISQSKFNISKKKNCIWSGPDTVLFFGDIKFGLGYLLNTQLSPIGRSESAFGHAGIGGACAYGDTDKKIGFSYINNKIHKGLKLYQSSNELSDILYKLV